MVNLLYDPFAPLAFGLDMIFLMIFLIALIPITIGIIIIVLIVRSIMGMGKDDKTIIRSPRSGQIPNDARRSRYERQTTSRTQETRVSPPPELSNPSGFCPNCGAAISKDDAFCVSCGRYLSE